MMMMTTGTRIGRTLLTIALLGSPTALMGQEMSWATSGEAEVVEGTGGSTLRFRSGSATLQDVQIENGSVSFVLKAPPARGFIGVRFRTNPDGPYEDFYLRPHKNNAPDALQYTPSFTGADTNWQLYHGPGGTAPAPTQDTHDGIAVELVFQGRDAAVFIGDGDEPALRIPRLALEPRSGGLTFWSNVLQPTEEELPVALENIRVRASSTRSMTSSEMPAAPEGAVVSWGLGDTFTLTEPVSELPTDVEYHEYDTEPDGTLMIDRFVSRPSGQGAPAVTAGIVVHADAAKRVRFQIGFSDVATVFLNGEAVFTGDLRYSYEGPMRQGFFQPDQNVLYLPLKTGPNELVVVVAEVFGGWALAGRFPDGGVRTEALR